MNGTTHSQNVGAKRVRVYAEKACATATSRSGRVVAGSGVWGAFKNAESPGGFYNANIRSRYRLRLGAGSR